MTDQETEYVESAKINLGNLAMQVPGLKDHPFYKIAMQQLTWATDGDDEQKQPGQVGNEQTIMD